MSWSAISKIIGVAAALFGAWLLYRVLGRYDAGEIFGALEKLGTVDIVLAVFFTILSFAFLSLGEFCAVHHSEHKVPIRRIVRTTVAAIGVGHAVGLAALSSGAIRYRMYRRAGVHLVGLGKIMLFCGLTVMVGMMVVGGIAMLTQPHAIAELLGWSASLIRLIGGILLALVATYIGLCALRLRAIHIKKESLALPSWKLAAVQAFAGAGNYASIAACLYACLRPFADADYPTIATLYVGSDATALIGHVPGGWGVLEYVMTAALDQPHLIAGVLVFRTIYYLVPLFIGLAVFAQDELTRLRHPASKTDKPHPPTAAAGLHR